MNPADATREIGWNISAIWLMYLLLAPTLVAAGFGLWGRVRLWRCGQKVARFDRPAKRLMMVVRHALLQMRTARQIYAGGFHLMIFGGFVVLAVATTVVMLDFDFNTTIMEGRFYLVFQSLIVDIFGGLVLVGIAMAAVLIFVINVRSFGWTMAVDVPMAVLVQAWLLAVIAALLAGIFPAVRATRMPPATALRYE